MLADATKSPQMVHHQLPELASLDESRFNRHSPAVKILNTDRDRARLAQDLDACEHQLTVSSTEYDNLSQNATLFFQQHHSRQSEDAMHGLVDSALQVGYLAGRRANSAWQLHRLHWAIDMSALHLT